ncbi:MAG: HD domain-containing protein [Blastocatellia bacterium]|nr:HD domain-containing protein [Blastocatellia bacterium]
MTESTDNEVLASLKYRDVTGKERIIPIAKMPFSIGRLGDNSLQLDDPYISRHHVEITYDGSNFRMRDKQSTSGSFVNDNKITDTVLRNGDRISLGRRNGGIELTFELATQPSLETGGDSEAAPGPVSDDPHQVMSIIDHHQTRYLNTSLIEKKKLLTDATVNRLKALYEITSSILSTQSRNELCVKLLDSLFEILPAERGVIMLADGNSDALQVKAAKHRSNTDPSTVHPSLTIVNRVFSENVATLCLDARSDSRFATQKSIIFQSIRSVICAPISSANRTWGVCYLDNLTKQKSFEEEELEFLLAVTRQAGIALENLHLIEEQKITFESFVRTLAASIDARDDLTAGHSARVARYSSAIAKYMELPPEERKIIYYAGLLHDYGKIGTREAILCKPGKLTPEEYDHMRDHAMNTLEILSEIHFSKEMENLPMIASSHHENVDGSGYPFGLKGDQIPLGGKIIAVADFFDALTHKRHYREPMPIEEVMELIEDASGSKFEPSVVTALKGFVYKEYIPNQKRRAEAEAKRNQQTGKQVAVPQQALNVQLATAEAGEITKH